MKPKVWRVWCKLYANNGRGCRYLTKDGKCKKGYPLTDDPTGVACPEMFRSKRRVRK